MKPVESGLMVSSGLSSRLELPSIRGWGFIQLRNHGRCRLGELHRRSTRLLLTKHVGEPVPHQSRRQSVLALP